MGWPGGSGLERTRVRSELAGLDESARERKARSIYSVAGEAGRVVCYLAGLVRRPLDLPREACFCWLPIK